MLQLGDFHLGTFTLHQVFLHLVDEPPVARMPRRIRILYLHRRFRLTFQHHTCFAFSGRGKVCGSTNSQSESERTTSQSSFTSEKRTATTGTTCPHTEKTEEHPTLSISETGQWCSKDLLDKRFKLILSSSTLSLSASSSLFTLFSFLFGFLVPPLSFLFFTFHILPQPTAEEDPQKVWRKFRRWLDCLCWRRMK